jgi:hypothetical protein
MDSDKRLVFILKNKSFAMLRLLLLIFEGKNCKKFIAYQTRGIEKACFVTNINVKFYEGRKSQE